MGIAGESEAMVVRKKDGPMKTIIYRVQDKDGRGPFRPGFSQYWLDADIGDRSRLPCWGEEFGYDLIHKQYKERHHYGSGVTNLDVLAVWFTKAELIRLATLRFFVVAMKVDRILAESTIQVVFERSRPLAKDVQHIPLERLFEVKIGP